MAFRLCFRQQSEAELPMPVSKEGMWDLGWSVSQDTCSTECQLTAQGLLGVTGRDSSQPQCPVTGQTWPQEYETPHPRVVEGKLRQR